MSGLVIKAQWNQPQAVALAEKYGQDFNRAALDCHVMWVLRVIEYMAKFSRVRTGRSRAGWFRYADSKSYDYYRSLPPTGGKIDETEFGRQEGDFIDEPFNTTLINNVEYVDVMNRRFGLFGWANMTSGKMKLGSSEGIRLEEKISLFEQYGSDNFQKFLDNAERAFSAGGKTFQPGEIGRFENEPPMTE